MGQTVPPGARGIWETRLLVRDRVNRVELPGQCRSDFTTHWIYGELLEPGDSRVQPARSRVQPERSEMAETIEVRVSPEQKAELDAIKSERRLTYSEVVKAALDAYFAPKAAPLSADLTNRLWSIDSASQKTAERLAAIDTQLDGLHGVVEQAMDLLILIGERMASAPVEAPEPTPQPAQRTTPPPVEEPPITDMFHDPRSQWYIPPPKEEKRGWFGRGKS
jgi:hypothetical protein